MERLEERIAQLKQRIEKAARKINRSLKDITIVCVVKQATQEELCEAIKQGFLEIGENRLQEAEKKLNYLKGNLAPEVFSRIRWHMVGHLQTNKVARALKLFHLIQSVDSLRLAQLIDSQGQKLNKGVDILVQVNISAEAAKFGTSADAAQKLIKDIVHLPYLKLKGLMGIAPFLEKPEETRPYFLKLKELFNSLNMFLEAHHYPIMSILSMGMSNDFEVAIEEGANMVRLGRAIFGG